MGFSSRRPYTDGIRGISLLRYQFNGLGLPGAQRASELHLDAARKGLPRAVGLTNAPLDPVARIPEFKVRATGVKPDDQPISTLETA